MGLLVAFAVRYLLVSLFFPFSALDKILNFKGAVEQASSIARIKPIAVFLILAGLAVEILMPLAVLTGFSDRLAAVILAAYCVATALLWKQWWVPGDLWSAGDSKGRALFWDFMKNLSLAGGFLLLAFGAHAGDLGVFLHNPLGGTRPYAGV
jgi:putative oxidoreductase